MSEALAGPIKVDTEARFGMNLIWRGLSDAEMERKKVPRVSPGLGCPHTELPVSHGHICANSLKWNEIWNSRSSVKRATFQVLSSSLRLVSTLSG